MKGRGYSKNYYYKNKDKITKQKREYYEKNKEKIAEKRKQKYREKIQQKKQDN